MHHRCDSLSIEPQVAAKFLDDQLSRRTSRVFNSVSALVIFSVFSLELELASVRSRSLALWENLSQLRRFSSSSRSEMYRFKAAILALRLSMQYRVR